MVQEGAEAAAGWTSGQANPWQLSAGACWLEDAAGELVGLYTISGPPGQRQYGCKPGTGGRGKHWTNFPGPLAAEFAAGGDRDRAARRLIAGSVPSWRPLHAEIPRDRKIFCIDRCTSAQAASSGTPRGIGTWCVSFGIVKYRGKVPRVKNGRSAMTGVICAGQNGKLMHIRLACLDIRVRIAAPGSGINQLRRNNNENAFHFFAYACRLPVAFGRDRGSPQRARRLLKTAMKN